MRLVLFRGVWCVYHNRRRISLRTKDRGEAERRLADLKNRPDGTTVGEIVESYLEKLSAKTEYRGQHYAWQAAKHRFAHLRPDQITEALCRAYIKERKRKKRSNGTIRKELGVIRTALNKKKIRAEMDLPPAPQPRERYLSKPEARALLEAASAAHIRLYIVLALMTLGRMSAILDLTWDRVDFKHKRIDLRDDEERRKGRAVVPMMEMAEQALAEAYPLRTSDYVVEYAGERVASVKTGFSAAVKRAGLKDVTPHVLRHTGAVWMAEAGRPMSEIARYLGHADSNITERVYAKYTPEHLRQAGAALAF